jgi:hypothetical protein
MIAMSFLPRGAGEVPREARGRGLRLAQSKRTPSTGLRPVPLPGFAGEESHRPSLDKIA